MIKTNLFKYYLVLPLILLQYVSSVAQGLYQGSTRVDRCANNHEGIAIPAGGSCVVRAELPTSVDVPSSVKWIATGGVCFNENGTLKSYITKDYNSSTDLSVTIQSKDGVSKEDGFSMFSKGLVQVMFVYNSGFCAPAGFDLFVEGGVGYVADVYKTFNPALGVTHNGVTYKNSIAGELCITPGDDVTFSVEPWVSSCQAGAVGFDDYIWSGYEDIAVNGVLKYSSNDKSSITFTVKDDADASHAVITCNVGKKNVEPTKTLTLALMEGITEPQLNLSSEDCENYNTTLSAGAAHYNCIPYEIDEFSIGIIDRLNWANYTWTLLRNNVAIQTGYSVDDNDVITIYGAKGYSYTLVLRVEGGSCSVAEYTYNIKRQLPKAENLVVGYTASEDECLTQNTKNVQLRLLYKDGSELESLRQSYYLRFDLVDANANGWTFTNNRTTVNSSSSSIRVNTGYDNAHISINAYSANYCPLEEPIVKELLVKPNAPTTEQLICIPFPVENEDNSFVIELQEDAVANKWQWILPNNWVVTANDSSSVVATTVEQEGKQITCFETRTNDVTISPYASETTTSIEVRAIGEDCSSDWNRLAIGYAYPNPTINVDGCLVPGGQVSLTAVGGVPNAQYSWNVSYASDENAISDGTSVNNSHVFFDISKRGPSSQYPIYLTTTNSCSSDNTVTEYINVVSSFKISYKYQTSNQRTVLKALPVDEDDDIDDYSITLKAYRYSPDGGHVLLGTSSSGTIYISKNNVAIGEPVFFRLEIGVDSVCNEVLEGSFEVPSIANTTYYIYDTISSDNAYLSKGMNKSLGVSTTETSASYAYPNPTSGIFKVRLEDADIYTLKIYDLQGSLVKILQGDDDVARADISELPSGSYTYVVSQKDNNISGVVIKK